MIATTRDQIANGPYPTPGPEGLRRFVERYEAAVDEVERLRKVGHARPTIAEISDGLADCADQYPVEGRIADMIGEVRDWLDRIEQAVAS